MKKKIVIITILISTVLLIAFIGSIAYSATNIKYEISVPITYVGYVVVSTEVTLNNNGFYPIKDLNVFIEVFGTNWQISSNLEGVKLGEGSNNIGTIGPGSEWKGSIEVNITNQIEHLAVEDCTLKIDVNIDLVYSPLIDVPLSFSVSSTQPYSAPF